MQVLALLSPAPSSDPASIRAHAIAENRAVWALYRSGTIRDMHFRTGRPGAVFRLECEDLAAAERALATLPLVEQGMLVPELIPIGPFIPLENLFESQDQS